MTTIKIYEPSMQRALDACFKVCVEALSWEYQPNGRHSDIVSIENTYILNGCFWCLYKSGELIEMAAMRCIDNENSVAELKRLYGTCLIVTDISKRRHCGLDPQSHT